MKHKKKLATYILAPVILLVAYCAKLTIEHSANVIYYKPIESKILTLNPKNTRQRVDFMIAKTIFGQFVSFDGNGHVRPGVFKSWEIRDDGRVYDFEIDTSLMFHDNKKISIDDVIFSFNYLASKDSLVSIYFSNIVGYDDFIGGKTRNISGIQMFSQSKLQIKLKRRSYIFLSQLADPKIVMLPNKLRNMPEPIFFEKPIGVGFYKLEYMNADHSHLILSKHDMRNSGNTNIKKYDIRMYTKKQAIDLYKLNKLYDLEVYAIDEEEMRNLLDNTNLYSTSAFSINLLLLNGRKQIFNDLSVRRRLAASVRTKTVGTGCHRRIRPNTGLVPQGLLGWGLQNESAASVMTIKINTRTNIIKRKELRILAYGQAPDNCIIDRLFSDIRKNTEFDPMLNYVDESTAMKMYLASDYDLLLDNLSVRGPEPFNIFTFFDPRSPHQLTFFNDGEISKRLNEIQGMLGSRRALAYSDLSDYIVRKKYYSIPLFTDIPIHIFSKQVSSKESPAILQGNTPFEEVSYE